MFDDKIPKDEANGSGDREGEFSLWLVRKGWAYIEADGESLTVHPGEWVICFGRHVTQRLSDDAHLLSLRMSHGWVDGTPLFSGKPLQLLKATQHPRLERLALRLLRVAKGGGVRKKGGRDPRHTFLWQNQFDYFGYLKYERTLSAWMMEFARVLVSVGGRIEAPGETDPRVAKVLQFLDSIRIGAPYPARELARIGGLSVGRLNRLSAKTYGFTTYAYWERRRVEHARLALQQREARIKEVAVELGFVQLSHFSAWFKRYTGYSPRAYRSSECP